MNRPNRTRILLAANAIALAALAVVELSGPAQAQFSRPRSTYTAASGRVNGSETHAVYIVDETTQEVIAVQWDPQSKQLRGLGYRNLSVDAADLARPRSN
ncbi:MAG: hypothetical protein RL136_1271 [Planctomycetota bacterium]|jgi:hypothetical protein